MRTLDTTEELWENEGGALVRAVLETEESQDSRIPTRVVRPLSRNRKDNGAGREQSQADLAGMGNDESGSEQR